MDLEEDAEKAGWRGRFTLPEERGGRGGYMGTASSSPAIHRVPLGARGGGKHLAGTCFKRKEKRSMASTLNALLSLGLIHTCGFVTLKAQGPYSNSEGGGEIMK